MLKIQAIGHLGKDAELSEYQGKKVINFNIAVTESWKDKEGKKHERTTWVNCSWWTERLAIKDWLKKGSLVYAEGIPASNAYNDKDGKPLSNLVCRVQTLQLIKSTAERSNASDATNAAAAPPAMAEPAPPVADDLPF